MGRLDEGYGAAPEMTEAEPEVLVPEIVPSSEPIIRTKNARREQALTREEEARKQEDILKGLQERVFKSSLQISADVFDFNHIDPTKRMEEDPIFQQWTKDFGDEEARRKYRVAAAGWLPSKEAPMAIAESTKMAVGIIKARAVEKGGSRTINVGKLFMQGEIPSLPEREVE